MFEHYYREIFGFLSGRIADRATAADLAQESYARVYAAQTSGSPIDDPRALLYRVARNLLVDHHRHSNVRTDVEIPVADDVVALVRGPKGLEPEEAVASRQGVQALARTIEGLPPRCRQAFMLNRFDGLSYAEVAAEMGISVKMVEQHISNALNACARSRAHGGNGDAGASLRTGRRKAMLFGAYTSLVMASGWLGWRQWQAQPRYSQRFETLRGAQSEAELPDGTLLHLDTDTQVEVTYYHQRRELRLIEGQVLLSVHKDADRPFQVYAGPVRVTVVGTRFSVRHTPRQVGAEDVEVAVSEGRVKVEALDHAQAPPVFLGAGDRIASDAHGALTPVTHIAMEQVGAWSQYHLRFVNRRLDAVLAELARYRDVPLVIRDPAVAALQVTGVFDPRDLTTFRRMLPQSLPVQLADLGDGRYELQLRR